MKAKRAMKVMKATNKILVGLLALLLVLTALPLDARAASVTISADNNNYDLAANGHADGDTITIADGLSVTLFGDIGTQYSNFKIVCGSNTNLTLSNVYINDSSNSGVSPLVFTGTGNTLTLLTPNSLEGGNGKPAVQVESGAALTIQGGGTLNAIGGQRAAGIGGGDGRSAGSITIASGEVAASSAGGAGIGGGYNGTCGTIVLSGGTINAVGNYNSAAIGSGETSGPYTGTTGSITISGSAVVTASISDSYSFGAGIGGGYQNSVGTVRIQGGTVHATGGYYGAGIGSCGGRGAIIISGGDVTATGGNAGAGIGGNYDVNGGVNTSVTITGGIIHATGTDFSFASGGGAGIGTNNNCISNGPAVSITGGTVYAIGGNNSPGIGTANSCYGAGSVVSISGGTVYATGGDKGAGIGNGYMSVDGAAAQISISGGEVYATGGDTGAGIGGVAYPRCNGAIISISGGKVYAATAAGGNAYDIGSKGCANRGTLTISGTAAVFTKNDSTDPTLAPITSTHTYETQTGGTAKVQGMDIPSGWSSDFGSYLRYYTLSYDPNNGTGTLPGPVTQYQNTTVAVASAMFTRTGYDYADWNTAADGRGTNYAAGFTFTFSSSQVLYAKWTPHTYQVQYNANGGSGSMTDSLHSYGVSKALRINSFTRAGYTFAGWAQTDSGAVAYNDRDSVTNLTDVDNATVQLYAQWSVIPYGITYHLNGGTVAVANRTGYDVETADFTLTNPTRQGYRFDGWSGTGISGLSTAVTIPLGSTGNKDYTANWTPIAYAVRYNANGGTGTMADSTHTYDVAKALTSNAFTRAGYTFAGWATTAGGAVAYNDRDSVTNLTDVDNTTVQLYAQWSVIPYGITYHLNGGTVAVANRSGYDAETADFTLTNPTKQGYAFAGWSESGISGLFTTVTVSHGTTGDKDYTANWTPIAYAVRYNANGGTGTMADSTHSYDAAKALTANAFTRAGYTFAGWATAASGAVAYQDSASVTNLTDVDQATVTLYAKWTLVNYGITYHLNGGTVASPNPTGYHAETADITLTNPTRQGYTFDGWSGTGITGLSMAVTIPKGSIGDREYTANWTLITYAVRYDAKGGSPATADQRVTLGAKLAKPADPAREGCTFGGWYSDAAGTAVWDFDNDTVTADITLYAKWNPTGVYAIAAKAKQKGTGTVIGSGNYTGGDAVTLTALPQSGYRFVRWTQGKQTVSASAVYTFPSSATRVLTANFEKIGVPALSAASAGYDSILVQWKPVPGAAGYQVYRADRLSGTYRMVASVDTANWTDHGRSTDQRYYYKVRAICVAGTATTTGELSLPRSAKALPTAPQGLVLTVPTAQSATIAYGPVAGASGYEIVRASRINGIYMHISWTQAQSYTNGSLKKGVTYYYKVRAYRLVGGWKIYGPYSEIKTIKK